MFFLTIFFLTLSLSLSLSFPSGALCRGPVPRRMRGWGREHRCILYSMHEQGCSRGLRVHVSGHDYRSHREQRLHMAMQSQLLWGDSRDWSENNFHGWRVPTVQHVSVWGWCIPRHMQSRKDAGCCLLVMYACTTILHPRHRHALQCRQLCTLLQ